MQEDGIGSLHAAYEELKAKLEKEGLFDQAHKKPIPKMPKCIGVLTSNTGSVIRDIINVSTRRNPDVYIRLLPVPVQGEGAGEKIAKAIQIMNEKKLADVLIIARGGGSLEDLWPFNEEVVAKAIYESELPVISAVGHETDFTIADFVADLRAPTPSAAAELAVPNKQDLVLKLESLQNRTKIALKKKTEIMRMRYEKCMTRRVFKEPMQMIEEKYLWIDMRKKRIQNSVLQRFQIKKGKALEQIAKLDALSPLKTLTRGYSITTLGDKVITKASDLKKDDEITLRFIEGETKAKVL